MKMNAKGNDCFETPDFLYKQLDAIFNFTLDAVIRHSAKKLPLSQRLIMKSSTANVPLSSWYCPQTARTAARFTNTYTDNSIMTFYQDASALWIRLPVERPKVIIPALLSSISRKTSQQGSKIIVN